MSRVIADYRAFTSGFVDVRDQRIKEFVGRRRPHNGAAGIEQEGGLT